jgi:hypothetical protein
VRGFLLNATNLAHHYGVVAKSFDAPGLAPGQRRLIQQRPTGLSKWLGALCRLLAAFGRLWRRGIATSPVKHSDGDEAVAAFMKEAKGGLCLGLPQGARLD